MLSSLICISNREPRCMWLHTACFRLRLSCFQFRYFVLNLLFHLMILWYQNIKYSFWFFTLIFSIDFSDLSIFIVIVQSGHHWFQWCSLSRCLVLLLCSSLLISHGLCKELFRIISFPFTFIILIWLWFTAIIWRFSRWLINLWFVFFLSGGFTVLVGDVPWKLLYSLFWWGSILLLHISRCLSNLGIPQLLWFITKRFHYFFRWVRLWLIWFITEVLGVVVDSSYYSVLLNLKWCFAFLYRSSLRLSCKGRVDSILVCVHCVGICIGDGIGDIVGVKTHTFITFFILVFWNLYGIHII